MQEKSFVTCFDKDCEEFAQLLMTLVSSNPAICNIEQKKELFDKDRKITSKEYVLTVGPKGSKVNSSSFNDSYNKYGIHIGYYGRKAWITCEKFKWNKNTLKEFHTELVSLLQELGMSTDNIDNEIAKNIEKVKTAKSLSVLDTTSLVAGASADAIMGGVIMTSLTGAAIAYIPVAGPFAFIAIALRKLIHKILSESERRKQQYKLAVILFYHKYINEFLELNNNKVENTEEEKKNF